MRHALFGSLVILGLLLGLLGSVPAQTPVGAVYGGALACDPAIITCQGVPLTISVLCTVTCPLRVSPSYASSTEFWAATGTGVGNCVRSTDGGATWPACTTQPFGTGSNELYAGASDGSVIAIGTETAGPTCTIRRSTNNATSWTTTFTLVTTCSPSNNEGQYLYCLADGRCELSTYTGGVGFRIIRSSDNGNNWVADAASAVGLNCAKAGSIWDGSNGLDPSEDTGAGCGGAFSATAYSAAGDVWAQSTPWTGTQGDCWGQVIYNGSPVAVCQGAGAAPDNRYTLRDSPGPLVASLVLPGALLTSIDAGGPAIAPFTDILYIIATRSTDAGIYVSLDNLNTFNLVGTLGAGVTVRGGNIFYSGGCIYFAGGIPRRFTKICR
jgi:hypothetical protein